MKEESGNFILLAILVILMIVAILIGILKPNKTEKVSDTSQTIEQNINNNPEKNIQQNEDSKKNNNQEEQRLSMQVGGTFCKIGNHVIFYEDTNKSIYLYNMDNNESNILTTINYNLNKMYFDGTNVYILPDYYSEKKIYKMDLQGNIKEIYNGSSLQLWITDNKIYFVNQVGFDDYNKNPQGTICAMDKDGTNIVEIAKSIKNYFYIQNNNIYYTTQDRKLNVINKDGTNQTTMAEGRKFVTCISEKYLLYVDYSNQEEQHILNLQTNADQIIGYNAKIEDYKGTRYISVRERLDDGSISQQYNIFKIDDNGNFIEPNNASAIQKELDEVNEKYKNVIGEYAYNIDNKDLQNIKIQEIKI